MKKVLFSLLMLCCMTAVWAQDDGFINVATTKQLWDAIKADARAKVRLTADFALSDINKDGETYCNTFYGTIDGNGHTIKGDPKADIRSRTYMFTYSEGATFKNLTFKGIRVNSQDHSNQAIITSQAKNDCVFENITFDNVHSFSNYNNVGAAAGYAYDCTFTNIKVKNSDFTVDDNYVGTVVGDADKCTFTNIEVTNSKTYTHDDCAGGVVGHSRNCKFVDVAIKSGTFFAGGMYVGGIAGKAVDGSTFANCVIDDQVCVFADGTSTGGGAYVGGIAGYAEGGSFLNCINSALVAANLGVLGGIVGQLIAYNGSRPSITGCLSTGLIVMEVSESKASELYEEYKKKQMDCVTKKYNGIEYSIRSYYDYSSLTFGKSSLVGGIGGQCTDVDISRSANIGVLCSAQRFHKVGGIAGEAKNSNITDCLIYAVINDGAFFIEGSQVESTSISNCAVFNSKKTEGDDETVYNYYINTNGKSINVDKSDWASGEYCLKLGENWEQNIGTTPYPTPTGNKGVYHTRKVSNQYGTVCLPFPVQSDDKISYYSLSRKEEDGEGIKLVFTYNEDKILEGTPLLFRSAEAKDADAGNPVEICFNNAGEEFTTIPRNKILDAGFWDLWGTFEQRVFDGDLAKHIYYVSGGQIKNAKKTTVAPYRAWIYGENIDDLTGNGTNQAKSISFVIEDADGSTTALEFVGNDLKPVQNGKAYSLMGTEVNDSYRGIVIRNGKKVLRK